MPSPKPANPLEYVLLGAGGHATSVCDVLASRGWSVVALVGEGARERFSADLITAEEYESSSRLRGFPAIVAIGDCQVRSRVFATLAEDMIAPAVIAATATAAESTLIGRGTVVHHHAHVGPHSVIGANVIVNTAAVVEHDCIVANGAHLAPGSVLLGGAQVAEGAFVGSGARVLPGVLIGAWAKIGAGAVVTKDVAESTVVVGVPAAVIDRG